MLRIRIDADNGPIEPLSPWRHGVAFTSPDLRVQKNLNPVADLDILRHGTLPTPIRPENETQADGQHDPAVDSPLRISGHKAARQHIDPLQEKRTASQEEDDADDG